MPQHCTKMWPQIAQAQWHPLGACTGELLACANATKHVFLAGPRLGGGALALGPPLALVATVYIYIYVFVYVYVYVHTNMWHTYAYIFPCVQVSSLLIYIFFLVNLHFLPGYVPQCMCMPTGGIPIRACPSVCDIVKKKKSFPLPQARSNSR